MSPGDVRAPASARPDETIEIVQPRWPVVASLVLTLVFAGVLGIMVLFGGAGTFAALLLVWLLFGLAGPVRELRRPARMRLAGGVLTLEMGGQEVSRPAERVGDVRLEVRTLVVRLAEPEVPGGLAARESVLTATSPFTKSQVERVRAALGLGPQREDVVDRVALGRSRRPVVTVALIACNVAVFLVMLAFGVHPLLPSPSELLAWGANFGPATLGGEPWRLLTSTFLHVGLVHLAFNAWALWHFGPLAERLLGHVGHAATYFLSGLGGALLSAVLQGDAVSAGASGAILGIAGAVPAFLVGRDRGLQALRSERRSFMVLLAFVALMSVGLPFIDLWGHAGGMAVGAACGACLRLVARRREAHGG